ncbi:hypothetical protein P4O66_015102 [Electrophorus voltai]|uniref:Uncharacterized protein n=1 Tax=Electrophorus voltai TaxID=2609070 RepID=A0AAD8Z084_9TELE|nr:hypothetical protein P4O66_015102 [Electrophorus voltai]
MGFCLSKRVGLCRVLQTPDRLWGSAHGGELCWVPYDPYMDFHKGYTDYGDYRECSDVSLRSDLGFDYGEDPSMEVEKVLYGDTNVSDAESADSESDEPLALKIPPEGPPRSLVEFLN